MKCPYCKHHKNKHKWKYKGTAGSKFVVWCDYCGFGWQHPFPSKAEVAKYYENQGVYSKKIIDLSQGGFPIRIQRLNKLKPDRGRLLDVGSGLGHFLKYAERTGWDIEGVEPRIEASRYCLDQFGIKVHTSEFEKWADSQSCRYDVITLWDVLEHVYDPFTFMEKCLDLLLPGGILALAIPNASGLLARLLKGRWRYVMEPHLNYFTMPYIYRLLERYNLGIEREDHTFKIQSLTDGFTSLIPVGKNYNQTLTNILDNSNAEKNKKKNVNAKIMNTLLPLVLKLNMLSIPFPIGDLVDIYCQKK